MRDFKNVFSQVKIQAPTHSTFDLSHDVKLSCRMGKLIPCLVQECIPGDKFSISTEAMFRMMPMITPPMHKVKIFIHHFFVPNRILWPSFERFITGGTQESQVAVPPAFPVIEATDSIPFVVDPSDLANYLNLPVGTYNSANGADGTISALPFAAYQRIWQEYYMDQNATVFPDLFVLPDGVLSPTENVNFTTLRDRCWEHDYFTASLPFVQKGADVNIPMNFTGNIEVKYDITSADRGVWRNVSGAVQAQLQGLGETVAGNTYGTVTGQAAADLLNWDPNNSLYVDPSDLNAALTSTINDLRQSTSLQKFLERNAVAGSRYKEFLMAHFAVQSSDARLDRPEYIGGSQCTMSISEVLQTGETGSTAQGNMAGHGISITDGYRDAHYKVEEHGWIIGILSIMPTTAYYQGVPKYFRKLEKLDYAFPVFSQLGEQPVRNDELYYDFVGSADENADVFAYNPIYSDMRYNPSRVAGQMCTTLENWHMARKFSSRPVWNNTFLNCDPTDRIFADTDPNDDKIIGHLYHNILGTRPLPYYGTPGGTL